MNSSKLSPWVSPVISINCCPVTEAGLSLILEIWLRKQPLTSSSFCPLTWSNFWSQVIFVPWHSLAWVHSGRMPLKLLGTRSIVWSREKALGCYANNMKANGFLFHGWAPASPGPPQWETLLASVSAVGFSVDLQPWCQRRWQEDLLVTCELECPGFVNDGFPGTEVDNYPVFCLVQYLQVI